MLFKVKWVDEKLQPNEGAVNAGNRYNALSIAQDILGEECIITTVEYQGCNNASGDTAIMNA